MKRTILILGALACLPVSNGKANEAAASANPTVYFNRPASAAPDVPLTGRVTDAAHILSHEQISRLTNKLAALENVTKHQLVVVTVPSLGGRDVATFTKRLASMWGIGRKGYNDGIVLLVAPNERKVRIAVGYGLETSLTHQRCREIINRAILPRFRAGDLAGGIEAGTNELITRLS